MNEGRIQTVAGILVDYATRVKTDDLVLIRGTYVAEPLMLALYQACLEKGAHPSLRAVLPQADAYFYRFAQEHQLRYIWETERWLTENLDVSITIISDTNTRQLSRVDPAKQVAAARARKPLLDRQMQRSATGDYRWNVTLYPTEAHAQDAEMSLAEYEDLYYRACFVDEDDPVARWRALAERHQRLAEWIKERDELHIEAEDTDLVLGIGGRTWETADGHYNFPDGEIYTAPVEDRTRGHVRFTYPAIYGGQAVEGVRLEFEGGRIVNAKAERNEEFLLKTLDTDPGARVLGEVGIGTNFGVAEFTGEALLDEKIGGTVHMAVGAAYPETGGTNESAVHWDMVCDLRKGGRITADGEVLLEDGKLLVE